MERVFSLGVISSLPQHGLNLLPHSQPRATATRPGREQEDFHFWLFHVHIAVSCAQNTEIEQAVCLFLCGEEQDPHLGGTSTLGKMGHVAIGKSCHPPHIVGAHRDAPLPMLINGRGLRAISPSESSSVPCSLPALLSVQADSNFIWKKGRAVSTAPLHPAQKG